jgi:hypothetical protein
LTPLRRVGTSAPVDAVYPGLAYFNEADKGGHFAAWEEPQLFSEELRAAFGRRLSPIGVKWMSIQSCHAVPSSDRSQRAVIEPRSFRDGESLTPLSFSAPQLASSFRHTTREIGSSTCQMLFCGGRNT